MKIAINTYPLKSGHKKRGIGFYTSNLIQSLKKDPSLTIKEFTTLSETGDADIIHYPWFDLFFHTLPIQKKVKTVVTIHDVIPLIFPKQYPVGIRGKINFHLQKIALKNCHIITDSQVSKKDIQKYLKINPEKVSVVYLAANENFKILGDIELIRTKSKFKLPNRYILYVGDANWVKNLPFLLEGYQQLIASKEFEDVKLVVVGGVFLKNVENINHPELESLKKFNELIKHYNLYNNVIKLGELELKELVCIYNLATTYVQPSLYEGFGLPLVEAFCCGTPVVCSNTGSLPEIGGKAAIYFDPTNLNQFVSILKDVVSSKSIQFKLSKLSLERAKHFSWEKCASDTKRVYEELIKNV